MKVFNLMNEPESYQLSIHVSNLIETYSKSELRASLVMLDVNLESMNAPLLARLQQLVKCYGQDMFSDVLQLHGVSNWNNIDFNQDDRSA